jgi:hypothetical protein
MRRTTLLVLLALTSLSVTAVAARRPPPRMPAPIALHERLSAIERDVLAIEDLILHLSGEAKTVVDVQRRLDRTLAELRDLRIDVQKAPPPVVLMPRVVPVPVRPAVVLPIPDAELDAVLASAKKQSFDREIMRVLDMGLVGKPVSVSQVKRVIALFTFSREQLEIVEKMNNTITDPENRFQLFESFVFSSDQAALEKVLNRESGR